MPGQADQLSQYETRNQEHSIADVKRVVGRPRGQLKLRFYDDPIELERPLEAKIPATPEVATRWFDD